jgi:hypothetical protein
MADERSLGSALMAVAAVALLGASLAYAWLDYDHSSGRQTPPGGPQDPDDTRVDKQHIDFRPFAQQSRQERGGQPQGEPVPATDPALAAETVAWMGYAVVAGMGVMALMALGEIPGIHRVIPRRAGLALGALGALATGTALALCWVRLPQSLAGYGVTWPFSYFLTDTGYTRTTLDWGWAAAAFALPCALGAILFKFQAGSSSQALSDVVGRPVEGEAA